jgi:Fe-S-cluster containining protein
LGLLSREHKIGIYELSIISPEWACGFNCKIGDCGYCCITEKPDSVPEKRLNKFDMHICAYYDMKNKLCLDYPHRPYTCNLFPFLFGTVEGQVTITTMLGCPSTNEKEFSVPVIEDILNNDNTKKQIDLQDRMYLAFSNTREWYQANLYLKEVKRKLLDLLHDIEFFPSLDSINNILGKTLYGEAYTGRSLPNIRTLLANDIKNCGAYIATRFNSVDCYNISLRGNRVTMCNLFDKKVIFQLHNQKYQVDTVSLDILKDYLLFVFERPLLLSAKQGSLYHNRNMSVVIRDLLFSVFSPLVIGSVLIGSRDKLEFIDADSMREIISYAEPDVITIFRRPDIRGTFI